MQRPLYLTEFPDFKDESLPPLPDTFEDESWRNDVCPSFLSRTLDLRIWVDYADPARREEDVGPKRFVIERESTTARTVLSETDDWAEIQGAVLVEAFVRHARNRLSASQFLRIAASVLRDPS